MKRNTDWKFRFNNTDNLENRSKTIGEKIKKSRGVIEPNGFFDPFLINEMDVAVDRILSAIKNKENVLIFGDYDCDGIFSTVILFRFLKEYCNCQYMIPDRFKDGYGLSMNKAMDISVMDVDLVITVDCGITSIEETEFLTSENTPDIIITDHHTCGEVLPKATAVLDCKRKDNTAPFDEICGAGLALKVVHALCIKLGLGDKWKDYLEYAAVATIADVVPLLSENRQIVKEGLKKLKNTSIASFAALIDEIGQPLNEITSQNIAFYMCPRINAASRMNHLDDAMALFLSDDIGECLDIAHNLSVYNDERKSIENKIFEEACEKIVQEYDFSSFSPILVCGDNWHTGVIGIVAAKIQELFCRPAIVLSKNDNETFSGSCRTFGDINIYDILKDSADLFEKFGGHTKAAGLSIKETNIAEFRKRLHNQNMSLKNCTPFISIDQEVPLSSFSIEEFNSLSTVEPFGEANPQPVFMSKNLKVKSTFIIGKDKTHLKLVLTDGKKDYSAIYFGSADISALLAGKIVDIAFRPSLSTYTKKPSMVFMIEDIHYNVEQPYLIDESIMFYDGECLSDLFEDIDTMKSSIFFTRDQFSYVFKLVVSYLSKYGRGGVAVCPADKFSSMFEKRTNMTINTFKLFNILSILSDCNYIVFKFFPENEEILLSLNSNKEKLNIKDSKTYRKLLNK